MAQPISTPMLIPRDILSAGEQVVFDKYKDQPAELAKRFTWWSMHDLMKYFHTEKFLTTLENDANMFSFQIDLTAQELAANAARNPALLTNLNTAMTHLQSITNEIVTEFNAAQAANAQQSTALVLNATQRRGGGKKKNKLRGGEINIAEKFTPDKIKKECFNDLKLDTFDSRDRIFIVDGKLPVVTEALSNQIADPLPEPAAPVAVAAPAPAPAPAAGGGKTRRRKRGSKQSKKGKTRKYRR
jgi:hypothetical protein